MPGTFPLMPDEREDRQHNPTPGRRYVRLLECIAWAAEDLLLSAEPMDREDYDKGYRVTAEACNELSDVYADLDFYETEGFDD